MMDRVRPGRSQPPAGPGRPDWPAGPARGEGPAWATVVGVAWTASALQAAAGNRATGLAVQRRTAATRPASHIGPLSPHEMAAAIDRLRTRTKPESLAVLAGLTHTPAAQANAELVENLRLLQTANHLEPTGFYDDALLRALVLARNAAGDESAGVLLLIDYYHLPRDRITALARDPRACKSPDGQAQAAATRCAGEHRDRGEIGLCPGIAPGPGSSADDFAKYVGLIMHEGFHADRCGNPANVNVAIEEFLAYRLQVLPPGDVPRLPANDLGMHANWAMEAFRGVPPPLVTPELLSEYFQMMMIKQYALLRLSDSHAIQLTNADRAAIAANAVRAYGDIRLPAFRLPMLTKFHQAAQRIVAGAGVGHCPELTF
jgi:hypothetical protein